MKVRLAGLAAGVVVAALSPAASASVTYVDASTANTTNADGTLFTPTPEATRSNTDNLWAVRAAGVTAAGTTAGGTLYESNGTGSTGTTNGVENSPELQTTVTGLTPGATYNVYAYFYDQTGNTAVEWGIEAGLTSTNLTGYTSAIDAGLAQPTPPPTVLAPAAVADGATGHLPSGFATSDGNTLYQASLGTAVADSLGNLPVFIDDLVAAIPANERTRYDGVGYELATTPEPASVAILAVGGVALAARRRR